MKFPTKSKFSLNKSISYFGLWVLTVASLFALLAGFFVKFIYQPNQDDKSANAGEVSPYASCQLRLKELRPSWNENSAQNNAVWDRNIGTLENPYVIGDDGWIFWNDQVDQYISQSVGRVSLTDQQVNRWHGYLEEINSLLESKGIAFYFLLTPSTTSIYPEEMPSWLQDVQSSTSADKFMSSMFDLPVIDVRAHLYEAKSARAEHLFSWSNSHWTDYGASVAWSYISQCVNESIQNAGELQNPAYNEVKIVGDFNEWESYGVKTPGSDWAVPVIEGPFVAQQIVSTSGTEISNGWDKIDKSQLPVKTTGESSWTGKSALILQDSMGTSLTPYWQQAYSPTWQIAYPSISSFSIDEWEQLISKYEPEVVIFEMAERFLINIPSID